MQTKLQELTEKIYQEGVNKSREDGEKILNDARKEAEALLANARKEAENTLASAAKQAEELKKNSINELQLSSRQLINDVRQKIVLLIEAKVVEPNAKESLTDVAFMKDIIGELVKNWNPAGDQSVDIDVLLPEAKKKELESFFKAKTGQFLSGNVEVSFSEKIKGGFKIGPKDGGYLISFTDDDFDNLFRSYLRPKLVELLFKK